MTPQQEAHLQQVKEMFSLAVDLKYRNGEKEHGGNLWEKGDLLDNAIDEAIDLFVYLITLKTQRSLK